MLITPKSCAAILLAGLSMLPGCALVQTYYLFSGGPTSGFRDRARVSFAGGLPKVGVKRVGVLCYRAPLQLQDPERAVGFMPPVLGSAHPRVNGGVLMPLYAFTLGWLVPMPRFIYESSEACVWNTEALRALIDLVRRADVERGKTSLWNVPDLLYRMPREDVVFGELARRFEKAGWAAVLLTPDQGPVRSILKQHTEDLDGICVLRYGMALEMNADLRQKAAGKQANPPEAPDGTISAFPAFLALSAKATAFSTKTGEEFFRFNCLGGEFLWGMHASTGRIFSWLSAPGELERAERAVVRKAFGSLDFAAR